MSKEKLPHMPLWVYDIDTDRDCRRMDDATFGRYMRLLVRQWIEGSIPANAPDAIRDACLDHDATDAVKALLDRKFKVQDGSVRRNARCHDEREEAIRKIGVNRENGKRGGRPSNNPSDNRPDKPPESDRKPNGKPRVSGCGSGSGSSSEGGCGGKPIEAVLRRMKGRKQHIPEIAVNLDRDIDAVAWWAEVLRNPKVTQPLGMIRHRILEGEDAPRVTGQELCDAVRAGVVKTINGVDVTGDPPLHNNGVGLCRLHTETHTQEIIVSKSELREVRLG